MSLITCPDCKKEVSDKAPNCPGCGRPMASFSSKSIQTRRKGGKYEGIGFLLIFAGIVTCFFAGTFGGYNTGLVGALLIIFGFIIFLGGRFM